jgi:hypothetical protein
MKFAGTLSAIGGALGLYTGFCGVTCFEILELVLLIIFALFGWNLFQTADTQEEAQQSTKESDTTSGQSGHDKPDDKFWRKVGPLPGNCDYSLRLLTRQHHRETFPGQSRRAF